MTISKTIYLQNKISRNRENLKSFEISMRKTSISYQIISVASVKAQSEKSDSITTFEKRKCETKQQNRIDKIKSC